MGMSGMGYNGSKGNQTVDAEYVDITPAPKPPDPPIKKKRNRSTISNKDALIKTISNRRLRDMQVAAIKEATTEIADKELNKAELAGQMLAGAMTPNIGPAKINCLTGHPDFKKIETELIITRGMDIEGMCRRWNIQEKDGQLAIPRLTHHFASMRRRYSKLFDTLDRASREKMANSYLAKVDEIYNLAKDGHTQAMSQQRKTDFGLITVPEYEAAAVLLEKMIAATTLIGAAMERQDKKEIANTQAAGAGSPTFNGPINKIQILGLPKAVPQKQISGSNI